ncbi:hypothetical protein K0M31_016039 [Melipona bicolor]|uniref:Uncharacterized protein n=1 Tax=Melipona bicolor TaxID=60889 RepID=A0AA40KTB9_9HYME|nr:hypothetical protein K0M31_016039 [Melipona bicolor]
MEENPGGNGKRKVEGWKAERRGVERSGEEWRGVERSGEERRAAAAYSGARRSSAFQIARPRQDFHAAFWTSCTSKHAASLQ